MSDVRDCIIALMGTPQELKLSEFFEQALQTELRRQRRSANSGEAFPPRQVALPTGRPPSTKKVV